jgi:RNA polymerase sigma factor (sigma-70 family)
MSDGRQADGAGAMRREGEHRPAARADASRKRAAVELIARHEAALKRTARRFSLDSEDAEDAYQRALEILLTKAPTTDPRELIRWTQTVVRHEALAVRQSRERLLGRPPVAEGAPDPIGLIPSAADGPEEQAERREEVARGREALRALKPAELRALTLLAEGYSYAEIGTITGSSKTKVNRLLSEGRARFRGVLSGSRDGTRCRQLQPLLSAFSDGEASTAEAEAVREHLRACGACRSTLRAYRAAPRVVAGLAPLLPPGRSLLGRLRDALAHFSTRAPGGDVATSQALAGGGSGGVGLAGVAKLLAICAGAAGGATACIATGVLPAPGMGFEQARTPRIERIAPSIAGPRREGRETAAHATPPSEARASKPPPLPEATEPVAQSAEPAPAPSETVEYEAPPPPQVTPAPAASSEGAATSEGGSAAGEFGP